jgi:hypothetical protein
MKQPDENRRLFAALDFPTALSYADFKIVSRAFLLQNTVPAAGGEVHPVDDRLMVDD